MLHYSKLTWGKESSRDPAVSADPRSDPAKRISRVSQKYQVRNVSVFAQLIFGPRGSINQLHKNPNIA